MIKPVPHFNKRGFGSTQDMPRDTTMFEAFVLVAAGFRKNLGVRRLYDRRSRSRPDVSLGGWHDAEDLFPLLGAISVLLVKARSC